MEPLRSFAILIIIGWFIGMILGMSMVIDRLSKIQRLLEKDKK